MRNILFYCLVQKDCNSQFEIYKVYLRSIMVIQFILLFTISVD